MNSFTYRYKKWLPDNVDKRHDTKTTYQVEIRYANNTNETFTFHGPPGNEKTIEAILSQNLYLFLIMILSRRCWWISWSCEMD